MKFYVPKSSLISPIDPVIRIEAAIDCDGSECRCAWFDDEGNLQDLPPHFHMVESQIGAGTRCYGIGGDIPGDVYEPSH